MILALLIVPGSCMFACSHTWRELNVSSLFQRMSRDMIWYGLKNIAKPVSDILTYIYQ